MDTDDNLWCIKLPNGDVRSGTLEQLDEAFQAGSIDENTLVLGEGSSEWVRLGELLGLEDAPASAPPTQPVLLPAPSVQPPSPDRVAPPPVTRSFAPAPPQTTGSLSPMTTTAVDEGAAPEFRSGSRTRRVFAFGVAVAAALGAAGFVAVRSGRLRLDAPSPPTVAVVPAYVAPPPEPLPPPAQTEVAPVAPQDSAPPRLSEQQRQQLQTADKARELKSKVLKPNGAPRPATRSKSTGFTTSGNKFDPLNASF